jgi:Lon protease-like protein
MAGDDGLQLPIFELPMAILPGELLPLHIFEERYKRMIGHCMEAEEPFGIVFRDDDGSARRIGCTARVTEVLERFDDGRMNIVVTGELPFRVLDRYEGSEFPSGDVSTIDVIGDGLEDDPEASEGTREAFAELVERVAGEMPETIQLDTEDAYGIASRVELPAETKQRLLESRSEPERMRVLGAALRALISAVDHNEEIAERAKMNGKVTLG